MNLEELTQRFKDNDREAEALRDYGLTEGHKPILYETMREALKEKGLSILPLDVKPEGKPELGKEIKYWSPEGNAILERLAREPLSLYEIKVLLVIAFKTIGFRKKWDWISFSQFQGFTDIKDRANVNRTIKRLEKKGLIAVERKTRDRSKYSLLM